MSGESHLPNKPMVVDDLLKGDLWVEESTPHIKVDFERCPGCASRPCVRLCPAECFTLVEAKVLFSYIGCLECGTCRTVCPKEAITWNYPRSGKGIQYRFA